MTGSEQSAPTFDLTSVEFWSSDPWPALAWMRASAPVHFDGTVWGIARHSDIKWVSANPSIFSNAQGARPDVPAMPFMIDMDDPEHLRRRRVVNRWFTPKRIAGLHDQMVEVTDEVIDTLCERGSCDAVMDLCAWLPMHVIGDMLGFPIDQRAELLKWSDDMLNAVGSDDADAVERAGAAFAGFSGFATEAIARRREDPGDDLLSVLVSSSDEELDEGQLLYEALLLLIGGDETTRHVLSGGLQMLLLHPEQRDRMLSDRSLIPTAAEEMLRWVSPVKGMARTLTTDIDLHGQHLEAGQKAMLLYPSANRDETIFDDPETFDIGRQPNDHLAFGVGPHFCLGASLARMELRSFFEVVFDRLPGLRLDGEPRWRRTNFIRGLEELPVSFTPTAPLGSRSS